MTGDTEFLLRYTAFLLTLLGFAWGLIRFLLARIDRATAKVSADLSNIHRR